jgi:hypothetical protein
VGRIAADLQIGVYGISRDCCFDRPIELAGYLRNLYEGQAAFTGSDESLSFGEEN